MKMLRRRKPEHTFKYVRISDDEKALLYALIRIGIDRFFLCAIKAIMSVKNKRRVIMGNSVYKIIEIVGTSTKSWEDAAKAALETAAKSLDDIRVAEVVKQDVTVENGKVSSYRIRLNISFKFHVGK